MMHVRQTTILMQSDRRTSGSEAGKSLRSDCTCPYERISGKLNALPSNLPTVSLSFPRPETFWKSLFSEGLIMKGVAHVAVVAFFISVSATSCTFGWPSATRSSLCLGSGPQQCKICIFNMHCRINMLGLSRAKCIVSVGETDCSKIQGTLLAMLRSRA